MTAYIEAANPGLDINLRYIYVQLIEMTKEGAQYCYQGYKAFGSAKLCRAETLLVLADEFRKNNFFRWHNRDRQFAVNADISKWLKKELERLPEDAWHLWKI